VVELSRSFLPHSFTVMGHEAQSTTNLGSSAVWTTNSPAAVVVNGQYTVTNPVSGSEHLLVTNVEAGTISVFNNGDSFVGNLQDPSGQDILLIGIWSSVFDNGDGRKSRASGWRRAAGVRKLRAQDCL